jgi:ribosomal protein S18 acetylase RimI-like enzyme
VEITLRRADAGDLEHIRWALQTAIGWNPERERLLREVTLEHPEAARYHRGWGRRGDIGVIAGVAGEVVGVAYCRLFDAEDHGHGYVDDETPEVTIAVREDCRGRGLGGRLMNELARAAREEGCTRLSLSVDAGNPARHLYQRLGYRELSVDEGGVRMVLELAAADEAAIVRGGP